MDSAQYKLITAIREYLDDIQGRQHLPISDDLINQLNSVSKELSVDATDEDLSPGERAAFEASEGLFEKLEIKPSDNLSPGQRAAQEVSATSV